MAEKYDVKPEQIRFENGIVHANGNSMTYAEVAKEMKAMGQQPRSLYEYEAPKTQPLGSGGDMHFAFSYGVQAAEVEVNKLTGEVRVLKSSPPTMWAWPSTRSACRDKLKAA